MLEMTLDQLVSRNLILADERDLARKDLEQELRDRIVTLEQRDVEMQDIYADEISLYVDLI
jgi:hypothetical protein